MHDYMHSKAGQNLGSWIIHGLIMQAVELFLAEKIGYLDVMKLVEQTCDEHQNELVLAPSLEEIVHYDNWARDFVDSKSAAVAL